MGDCTTIFETLEGFLPKNFLEETFDQMGADHNTRKLTVLRQLNTYMYAHLTDKKGLRDIDAGIKADKKLQEYTSDISFSQLSRKNSDREPEYFRMIFEAVLAQLKKHHGIRVIPGHWGALKVLDATIVRLCITLFPWARYREKTAAVKMHTLYDILCDCPEHIVLTEGILHDKEKMSDFVTEPGITYLFDRGYLDYKEFDRYCHDGIYFVTRLKKNAVYEIITENIVMKGSSVLSDKEAILGGFYTRMQHPLRLVEVIDSSTGEAFFIVTNRFDLTAEEIADIYRLRWQIELFFKWIKQHLKIKKFFGTSFNAVLNQILAALILFILLKLMHLFIGLGHDFLKLVRLIASGLWNTVDQLRGILSAKKSHKTKRKRWNWKRGYAELLLSLLVSKY